MYGLAIASFANQAKRERVAFGNPHPSDLSINEWCRPMYKIDYSRIIIVASGFKSSRGSVMYPAGKKTICGLPTTSKQSS